MPTFRILRWERDCTVAIVVSPGEAELDTPGARFYRFTILEEHYATGTRFRSVPITHDEARRSVEEIANRFAPRGIYRSRESIGELMMLGREEEPPTDAGGY
jgi:hypothetical protein